MLWNWFCQNCSGRDSRLLAHPSSRDEHLLLRHEHVHPAKVPSLPLTILQALPWQGWSPSAPRGGRVQCKEWGGCGHWMHQQADQLNVSLLQVEYKSYYQWVPFVLLLQACLFYTPHALFKMAEGGKVNFLVIQYFSRLRPSSPACMNRAPC